MHNTPVYATTEDVVIALSASAGLSLPPKTLLEKAYYSGWLEQQDLTDPSAPLQGKHLARILHQFLLLVLKEPDEADVSPAYALKDLYDCRTCAGHVMQIYAKGIMDGYHITPSLYLFGMNDSVTLAELDAILKRVYHSEYRLKR